MVQSVLDNFTSRYTYNIINLTFPTNQTFENNYVRERTEWASFKNGHIFRLFKPSFFKLTLYVYILYYDL